MTTDTLYWHCLHCGAHDPVEPTGGAENYTLGDPCHRKDGLLEIDQADGMMPYLLFRKIELQKVVKNQGW